MTRYDSNGYELVYVRFRGFVIEEIEVHDETAEGEPLTHIACAIRREGNPKRLGVVDTVADGRNFINDTIARSER